MATITSPRSDSPALPVQRITSPSIPSTSGTPTSSVRPSLDLPRTTNPASAGSQQNGPVAATAQRRNRAALRDYYHLKAKASTADGGPGQRDITRTASITSIASDSTITSSTAVPESTASSLTEKLDDADFNAESYVSEVLKTASLRDILKTESALVSEIRNLDGERKALVYDNYSKLIKAVGTIAEMQKGMHKDGNDDRLAGLLGRQKDQGAVGLDGVKEVAEKLDGLLRVVKELSPQERGEAEQSLQGRERRRQQEIVKWALAAPAKLQRMIDEGRRNEAESLHASVLDQLRRWKGVDGVEGLQRKCAEIINSGKEELSEEKQHDDAG